MVRTGIIIKDDMVVVKLNENIYCSHCIENAIKDFKDVCKAKKTKHGIELSPISDVEPGVLGLEFSNYVLGLMKN